MWTFNKTMISQAACSPTAGTTFALKTWCPPSKSPRAPSPNVYVKAFLTNGACKADFYSSIWRDQPNFAVTNSDNATCKKEKRVFWNQIQLRTWLIILMIHFEEKNPIRYGGSTATLTAYTAPGPHCFHSGVYADILIHGWSASTWWDATIVTICCHVKNALGILFETKLVGWATYYNWSCLCHRVISRATTVRLWRRAHKEAPS